MSGCLLYEVPVRDSRRSQALAVSGLVRAPEDVKAGLSADKRFTIKETEPLFYRASSGKAGVISRRSLTSG